MKTIRSFAASVVAIAITLGAGNPAAGAAGETGFYFTADAGVGIAENVDINEVLVPTPGLKTDYDPGARLSVGAGYRLMHWLAVEIESGFAVNTFADGDAAVSHVPLLANVVLRGGHNSRFKPFLGGGGGMSVSVLSLDDVSIGGSPVLDGAEGDAVFAYQGFAGFTIELNDRMSIGAVYKFLGTGAPSWDVENTSGRIRFDEARIHSFGVSFNMKF